MRTLHLSLAGVMTLVCASTIARVASAEEGSAAFPVMPQAISQSPRAPLHAEDVTGVALVHIDAAPPPSGGRVVLETVVPGIRCEAPCDALVPVGVVTPYRIVGRGIRPSREFSLNAQPGQSVVLSVSESSQRAYWLGLGIFIGGTSGLLTSVVAALIDCPREDQPCHSKGVEVAIIVLAVASGVATLASLPVWVSNSETGVHQTTYGVASPPPSRSPSSWLGAPEWREPTPDAAAGHLRLTFPIFSRTF
jgi:hypothetical protein